MVEQVLVRALVPCSLRARGGAGRGRGDHRAIIARCGGAEPVKRKLGEEVWDADRVLVGLQDYQEHLCRRGLVARREGGA